MAAIHSARAVDCPQRARNALRVLVVDDSVTDQKILAQLLREGWATGPGLQIDFAFSVEDAIRHWHGRHYNLVVLDWRLPKQTGGDLLHWLRQQKQWMPVIVVSAWPQHLMPIDFAGLGAVVLTKDNLTSQDLRVASETATRLVASMVDRLDGSPAEPGMAPAQHASPAPAEHARGKQRPTLRGHPDHVGSRRPAISPVRRLGRS